MLVHEFFILVGNDMVYFGTNDDLFCVTLRDVHRPKWTAICGSGDFSVEKSCSKLGRFGSGDGVLIRL